MGIDKSEHDVKTVTKSVEHGEVEYDTVNCANCENDVMVENAVPVMLGRKRRTCSGHHQCREKYDKFHERRALCEYCADSLFDYARSSAWDAPVKWFTTIPWHHPFIFGVLLTLAAVGVGMFFGVI